MNRLQRCIVLTLLVACAAAPPEPAKTPGRTPMKAVKLRGEIVDWYCYIQKGATGIDHKDCGTRCVAGDICMGLLTTDGDLYMISQDHMRAMDPSGYRGVVNPFDKARGLMAWTVDLVGHALERKGQRIVEIVDVFPVSAPVSSAPPEDKSKEKAPPAKGKSKVKPAATPAAKGTKISSASPAPSCDVPQAKSH
jgi:hypothetical protein